MVQYTIEKISKIVDGKVYGNRQTIIKDILTDSRNFIFTKETLFFAICGERHNGHNFISDLFNKNIRNFVIEKKYAFDLLKKKYDANFIIVDNSMEAIQKLSAYHRKLFDIPIVGITGSNGKTIVKEWIFQLIKNKANIIRNPKSYNSQIGVPLSVFLLVNNSKLGIFEAGISQKNEMQKLQKIIKPTIGIFTNIGEAHQENFNNYIEKITEKLKLFKNSKLLVYNKNNTVLSKEILKFSTKNKIKLFSWSATCKNADIKIIKIIIKTNYTKINIEYQETYFSIKIPFTDKASIENSMHTLAFIIHFFSIDYAKKLNFENLVPISMRLEFKKGINNCLIINDSYNSDFSSLKIALDLMLQQNYKSNIVVLSDILQSGKTPELLYSEIAKMINKSNLSKFIAIGKEIGRHKKMFKVKSYFYNRTEDFIKILYNHNFNNDVILIKGSRKFKFEKITRSLQLQSHRTVLEINFEAIINNLNFFRSLLKTEVKIMIMVKAFSYGSGSFEIAKLLEHHRVSYFGVAYADEGVVLRKAGIITPIMVMNPDFASFNKIIKYNLEPEIYSFELLENFNKVLISSGIQKAYIHIKLDTGMKRLGFSINDTDKLILKLRKYRNIQIKSIFSHLVASDDKKHDKFTQKQIKKFTKFCNEIQSNINYKFIRHILNSSGIERWHTAQFDMVRLGIGLYGIGSENQNKLMNISTLKTKISQIRKVKKNTTLGYSRKWKVTKNSRIATIPIGYADGLNRLLSNGVGRVLINNKFAPIVGNICMDMCMIDISEIDANEGDDVIIFGDKYSITKLADLLNTIPYEILTGISQRVKRIYLH